MSVFSGPVIDSYTTTLSCLIMRIQWGKFSTGCQQGGVTSDLRENGGRFLTPLVCVGCLLAGLKSACSGESGGLGLRSARAKATFHPVRRQPAQTSGVRKHLPFRTGVITHLKSHLGCQVAVDIYMPCMW